MSPAHKLSSINTTTKCQSDTNSFTLAKANNNNKKVIINEDVSEIIDYGRQYTKNQDLCTIQENKTSDTERSGESVYDDSSSNKKHYMFDESYSILNDKSPVLTFIDSEKLLFSRCTKNSDADNHLNVGYVDHTTDKQIEEFYETEKGLRNFKKPKLIRQSISLDFSRFSNENRKRKLSIETKLESFIQPKGFIKDTISRLFEQEMRHGLDNFKSYLCDDSQTGSDDL